jgi:hypothetical protein
MKQDARHLMRTLLFLELERNLSKKKRTWGKGHAASACAHALRFHRVQTRERRLGDPSPMSSVYLSLAVASDRAFFRRLPSKLEKQLFRLAWRARGIISRIQRRQDGGPPRLS